MIKSSPFEKMCLYEVQRFIERGPTEMHGILEHSIPKNSVLLELHLFKISNLLETCLPKVRLSVKGGSLEECRTLKLRLSKVACILKDCPTKMHSLLEIGISEKNLLLEMGFLKFDDVFKRASDADNFLVNHGQSIRFYRGFRRKNNCAFNDTARQKDAFIVPV